MYKYNLKDTLKNSYTKNIDYIIKKQKSTSKGGRPSELIMLTLDCFKRISMSSTTEKSKEVQSYFIELETQLDKYKNFIIEGLNKRIGVLENNQKPKLNPKSGVIYVLKTDHDINNIYKIGKTQNFKNRLKTHNTSHVDDVDVVFVYETDNIDRIETCIKNSLIDSQYRNKKEFYQVDLEIIKNVFKICEILVKYSIDHKQNSFIRKISKYANKKLYIMVDKSNTNQSTKKFSKKISKKPTRKLSKKLVKKPIKKPIKRQTRKIVKKLVKKQTKKLSKKPTKKPNKKPTRKYSRKTLKGGLLKKSSRKK